MPSTLRPARPHPPTSEAPPAPAASPAPRDPWFDNAKMLLVTFVVVGHAWGALPDTALSRLLHDVLYLWHVPAFAMVTGYLSRSFQWTRAHLGRLVTTVAVPYVVAELAVAAFRVGVRGGGPDMLVVDPHWPLWFLVALVLWRLAAPVLRPPLGLPLAVATSLAGGVVTTEVLDLSRVLGLLPFFVVGLAARREHVALLRRASNRTAAVGLLGAALLLSGVPDGPAWTEWLYWRSGYAELGVPVAQGMALRFGLLVAAAVVALAFLALVPERGGWFSRLGPATMTVYLLHGVAVKAFEYAGPPAWFAAEPLAGLLVTTVGAVLLALALASPPVADRLSVVTDPVSRLRPRPPHRRLDHRPSPHRTR